MSRQSPSGCRLHRAASRRRAVPLVRQSPGSDHLGGKAQPGPPGQQAIGPGRSGRRVALVRDDGDRSPRCVHFMIALSPHRSRMISVATIYSSGLLGHSPRTPNSLGRRDQPGAEEHLPVAKLPRPVGQRVPGSQRGPGEAPFLVLLRPRSGRLAGTPPTRSPAGRTGRGSETRSARLVHLLHDHRRREALDRADPPPSSSLGPRPSSEGGAGGGDPPGAYSPEAGADLADCPSLLRSRAIAANLRDRLRRGDGRGGWGCQHICINADVVDSHVTALMAVPRLRSAEFGD